MLFAYFNNITSSDISLNLIIYGYTNPELGPVCLRVKSDEFGRVYLPKYGWLKIDFPNYDFNLCFNSDVITIKDEANHVLDFEFEPIEYIEGTSIEFIKYPISLLKPVYFDEYSNLINVEIGLISEKARSHMTTAWNLIKNCAPNHFRLIQQTTRGCIVFNVNTYLRNSFATLSAHGIGFFNSYQSDYNEVFFVDDIAHQTGHVIFNSLIYLVHDFIAINPETVLQSIALANNTTETRNVHVIFHALYTYYSIFICLNACLDANVFDGQKRHEALGRIRFYLVKCYNDLHLIESPSQNHGKVSDLFTLKGLAIYRDIAEVYNNMLQKWGNAVKDFTIDNQPYNFTYAKFLAINPFE